MRATGSPFLSRRTSWPLSSSMISEPSASAAIVLPARLTCGRVLLGAREPPTGRSSIAKRGGATKSSRIIMLREEASGAPNSAAPERRRTREGAALRERFTPRETHVAPERFAPGKKPLTLRRDLEERAVVEPQRREYISPHAAGVEGGQVRPQEQPERRPVSTHRAGVARAALRVIEPGHEARGGVARAAVEVPVHGAVARLAAQRRERRHCQRAPLAGVE